MLDKILAYDTELLIYLNNLGTPTFDGFWLFVTNILAWIPLYLLLIYLVIKTYTFKKAWKVIIVVVVTLLLMLLVTELVKETVARVRPNNNVSVATLLRVLKHPTNYSFFSGHATTSFTITIMVVLFLKKHIKNIKLLFLWPILFSLSRIYVGVHYPLDILVGALIGILVGYYCFKISTRYLGLGA